MIKKKNIKKAERRIAQERKDYLASKKSFFGEVLHEDLNKVNNLFNYFYCALNIKVMWAPYGEVQGVEIE